MTSRAAVVEADRPVVLITGSSTGVGHALARRLAARGWRVFASMRSPDKGSVLRDEAVERGWSLTTPALDVTDDRSVDAAVAELLAARRWPSCSRRREGGSTSS